MSTERHQRLPPCAGVDIQTQDGRIELPVKDSIKRELESPAHRAAALEKAEGLIASISGLLVGATWFHDSWTREALDLIELTFDGACDRWRRLYRSAVRQRELHHNIIVEPHETGC